MIGPAIPDHVLRQRSSTPPLGPSASSNAPESPYSKPDTEPEEDEDDYAPALPPDLIAQRASQKRVLGPTLPSAIDYEEDEDDDVGPMPSAYTNSHQEEDGVAEFIEREKRRKEAVEEASKPKALKREEWMLIPPSASDLLGSIDPTRLNKGRKFAPTTTSHSRNPDSSLWTETPAEKQQRIADELSGKRRRKENSDMTADDELEARKKRKRDEEIHQAVSEHTRQHRPETLLQMHSKVASAVEAQEKEKKDAEGIWDHSRDMALSGRLMDDKTRSKIITDSKGLGDRFGSSKFA